MKKIKIILITFLFLLTTFLFIGQNVVKAAEEKTLGITNERNSFVYDFLKDYADGYENIYKIFDISNDSLLFYCLRGGEGFGSGQNQANLTYQLVENMKTDSETAINALEEYYPAIDTPTTIELQMK
jgi:hypothetical protein